MSSEDGGASFDDVNESFHERYGRARDPKKLTVPVFVLLGDELVFFQRGERRAFNVTPRTFHLIKSVAHAPIALYTAMKPVDASTPDLERLVQRVDAARESAHGVLGEGLPSEVLEDVELVLAATATFAKDVAALPEAARSGALEAFAGKMREPLLRLTSAATRLQIDALHETVERILTSMTAHDREHLQVVVAGQHQARVRSLGMQYFRKRLGEPEDDERRVAYAEGITREEEALTLVATRRLDTVIAKAFFGDPHRLQRDVLGDAVADLLEGEAWPRI